MCNTCKNDESKTRLKENALAIIKVDENFTYPSTSATHLFARREGRPYDDSDIYAGAYIDNPYSAAYANNKLYAMKC